VAAARAREDGREAGEFALVGLLGYLLLGAFWLALTPVLTSPALDLLRIVPLHRAEAAAAFLLGPVAFAFAGTAMVTATALQGWGRFDLANVVTLTSALVQAGGALYALDHGWGLVGVLRFAVAGSIVATLAGLLLLRLAATGFRWGSPAGAVRRVRAAAAFGGPLQLANILGVAHQQLDKILLSRYVALMLVAPYEIGLRGATVLGSVPQQILVALLPAASEMHAAGDLDGLRTAHERAARWVMAVTAAIAAGCIAAAPRLLVAWLGRPPQGADLCLVGLTLAIVVAMTTGTGTAIARAICRTRYEAEFSAVGLVAHVALGIWLVPRFGLLGAVEATIAANVCAAAWFLFRFARLLGVSFESVVARPALPPIVALAVLAFTGRWLASALPAGTGLMAWLYALIAAAAPAVLVLAALAAARFLPASELRALLASRRATGPRVS